MLTQEQVAFFERHGYLSVENLVSDDLIDPVIDEYEKRMKEMIDAWVEKGDLGDEACGLSFEDSIMKIYESGLDYFQPLDISLPQGGVKEDTPMHTGPEVFRLMTANPILDAVETLIGPEITSNPIQHVRLKPPSRILENGEVRSHVTHTQWHQDRGVATVDADQTHMVTVWLAISDATKENGCLRVVPDTQHAPMMPHCIEPQVGIPDRFVNEAASLPLEIKKGGAIFFHPLTIHGAGSNVTESLRWSFDLRYNITGEPTGREHFPDFVARSRKNPASELHDPEQWAQMWAQTKQHMINSDGLVFNRWDQNAPVCA